MAFVRRRGNQLAIVTGTRNPATKQVEQQILFTVYSKPEALEILGRGEDPSNRHRFESMLSREHPGVRFDWKKIRAGLATDLDHLPDSYEYADARLQGAFRESLVSFARALMLSDPQHLVSAGALLRENRGALEFVAELIGWRVRLSDPREENDWNKDNRFFWRFALQGKDVPSEIEEHAAGLWERRELDKAEAAFQLIADAFPGDPEAWNYLGLIAKDRGEYELAEKRFLACRDLARKALPKHVRRSSWWTDLKTRPYMRALMNLADTLNRMGRCYEAMAYATQLEKECGDDTRASSHRAAIALNARDFPLAASESARLTGLFPDEGFTEGLARFEMGEGAAAIEPFLHASMNSPLAAKIILRLPSRDPRDGIEARDHNAGVRFIQSQRAYIGKADRARAFFTRLLKTARVADCLRRLEELKSAWHGEKRDADRSVFDEMHRMESRPFARELAREVQDALLIAASRTENGTPARRPRRASRDRSGRDLH